MQVLGVELGSSARDSLCALKLLLGHLFSPSLIYYHHCVCVHAMCVHDCGWGGVLRCQMAWVWRSEDNFMELAIGSLFPLLCRFWGPNLVLQAFAVSAFS